jgi:hypothetical protein
VVGVVVVLWWWCCGRCGGRCGGRYGGCGGRCPSSLGRMMIQFWVFFTAYWRQEVGYVFERNAENVLFSDGKYFRKDFMPVMLRWIK